MSETSRKVLSGCKVREWQRITSERTLAREVEALEAALASAERVVEAARKMLIEHDTEMQELENEARLARALRAHDTVIAGLAAVLRELPVTRGKR